MAACTQSFSTSMPSSSLPRTTFTCFKSLPAELRFKIWEFALPPRIIELIDTDITQHGRSGPHRYRAPRRRKVFAMTTREPVPVLLQVCREAATLTKRLYPVAFQEIGLGTLFGGTRFNFHQDMLFLSGRTFTSDRRESATGPVDSIRCLRFVDTARVKRLVLELEIFEFEDTALIHKSEHRGRVLWPAAANEDLEPCPEDWGHDKHGSQYLWTLLRILRHFPQVKELFLALDYRVLSATADSTGRVSWEPSAGQLALADPEDISSSLHYYSNTTNPKDVSLSFSDMSDPRVNGESEVNKYHLAKEILEDLCHQLEAVNEERARSGKSLFQLPRLRFKSITSSEKWQKLQELRKIYYQDYYALVGNEENEEPLKALTVRLDNAGRP